MAKDQDQPMTFTEHLGELRNRLIKSVVAVIIGFAVAYSAHEHVFRQWHALSLLRLEIMESLRCRHASGH